MKLSHLDDSGSASMVDISDKPITDRLAVAYGEVVMKLETLQLIENGNIKKGDVLTVAQIAGITAAKKTAELIPLCHPIPINHIEIKFSIDENIHAVLITASVRTNSQTGVEMEALTAVSISALTIYDMVKAVEKTVRIQNIRLVEKHGGQSGDIINL